MKQSIKNLREMARNALLVDRVNLHVFLGTLCITLFDLILWQLKLVDSDVGESYRINISPISYLLVIIVINTVLSISAHVREAETSRLLLSSTLLISAIVLVLELFYLSSIV